MPEELVETKDGVKIRKLVELKTSTAEEYQEAMLNRVEYFKEKNQEKSQFNSFIQNTVVKGFSTLLNLKTKIDESLGEENLKKVHEVLDSVLMFGL
ncbi:MAG: hypothetical protein P8Y23_06325 [Candidatus Lokiarchaeota archaeon]|jgi:hypothetical protein